MKFKTLLQFILVVAIVLVSVRYVVFAQSGESLDALMSETEMKRTGVYKLSTTERIELKNWIDRNFIQKRSPASRTSRQLPTVSEVISGGQYIKLDDDTSWQIYPSDTQITQGWLTPVPIEVTFTGQGAYPYTLTNTITGSEVRARKVTHIPNRVY